MTQDALLAKSAEEWLDILDSAGVPCAPVLKRKDMIKHPVVTASELIIETEHPIAGSLRQTRPAARFSKAKLEVRRGAPLHAEHNEEILNEIGITATEQSKLRDKGIIS